MIVVIDYRAGNLYNVGHALRFLGFDHTFSGDPEIVSKADRIILPGVGSARPAMDSLNEKGLSEVLRKTTARVLGICLGLQLFFEGSEEEETPCLGILEGTVRKLDRTSVKVPHIGWNQVEYSNSANPLFHSIENQTFFYFVHSFYAPASGECTLAETEYDIRFASAVRKSNFWGVQFHPERSGQAGLHLLRNFLQMGND